MADNDWINGYLEAILDTEGSAVAKQAPEKGKKDKKSEGKAAAEKGDSLAVPFFVKQITGFDETDLHRTWMKATAMKNVHERGSRLEYLCWRIWHMTRLKKKVEWEEAQQLAHLHMQRESDRAADEAELVDDLDTEEEESASDSASVTRQSEEVQKPPAAGAGTDKEQEEKKEGGLYIVMISLHGLVRGEHMELGRDADTGGQVKYVVEFAKALAELPQVYRVDLLTRQITDPSVDYSYGEPQEMLTTGDPEGEGLGESAGAYIVRIPCGPKDKYVRKEDLWPHIQEFVDGAIGHVMNMVRVLGEQIGDGEPVWPHVIHGHYADAGDIAALLSGALNVPMVLTGHSLGRNKLEQLLKQGRQSRAEIDSTYRIMRRIEAEEFALDAAELVVTSTQQEIIDQWGLYDGYDAKLERVLRIRARKGFGTHGRFMPRMAVIPPGMDFSHVVVQTASKGSSADLASQGDEDPNTPRSPKPDPPIWSEVNRFFSNPHKPMILALARADPKKNLPKLVEAFGENKHLRDTANLTLIMGNRDVIDELSGSGATVLTQVLKLIDKYDLYGHVSYPKHHKQPEVPEIYKLAARSKGVFVNPALVEPFGLTLIEAAAYGLPMVATKNGGPVDIQRTLNNGVLVDPHDETAIADAMLKLVTNRKMWSDCRRNGLQNIHKYSWPNHCRQYLQKVASCRQRHPKWKAPGMEADSSFHTDSIGNEMSMRDMKLSLDEDNITRTQSGNWSIGKLARQGSGTPGDSRPGKKYPSQNASLQGLPEDGHAPETKSTEELGMRLRERKHLVVVAVDDYDAAGKPKDTLVKVLSAGLQAAKKERTGFAIATALSGPELVELLDKASIGLRDLDVVIAGSGSELYYPGPLAEGDKADKLTDSAGTKLYADGDYTAHVEYRWGNDGLRKAMVNVVAAGREKAAGTGADRKAGTPKPALTEDRERIGQRRLAYKVVDLQQAPSGSELRRRLRTRGLRCHVVYCRGNATLHLLPVHASRSQALRYLAVRWGIEVSNMIVVAGYAGDADHIELLGGAVKVVLVGGVTRPENATKGSAQGSTEEDPAKQPNATAVDESKGPEGIVDGLKALKLA